MLVSSRGHLRNAAILWSGIGLFLATLGIVFILQGRHVPLLWLWVLLAVSVGFLKGQTVLAKAANRTIVRIRTFEGAQPFFRVFKPAQWLVILFMMGLGFIIRSLGIEKQWRGLVLLAIGFALLWASRNFWKACCCNDATVH